MAQTTYQQFMQDNTGFPRPLVAMIEMDQNN